MAWKTYEERKEDRRLAEETAADRWDGCKTTPPLADLDRFKWLMETAAYTFAKTYAEKNPHWYTLRKGWQNDEDFIWCVLFIRQYGLAVRFPDTPRGWPYIVFDCYGHRHWTMGEPMEECRLINRRPL